MVSAPCYRLPHWHVKPHSCRAIEERDKINISVQWWRYQARNHEPPTSALLGTNTAKRVCAQIFEILKENWTLCLMKPQSGEKKYIVMAFMLLSWAQKSGELHPTLAVWSESCWLCIHCKVTPVAWVQQGWERGAVNGTGETKMDFPSNCSLARASDTVWAGN